MIFETGRLIVRKLKNEDFEPFHEMQSNPNVMRFVRGKPMTYEENKKELPDLIGKYDKPTNDFWIYAIERKKDSEFIGTIAFVKNDEGEDEIGYRFLEKYWRNGYAKEILNGMIVYARNIGFTKLIACVAPENIASEKIIKSSGFKFQKIIFAEDLGINELKYILEI